MVVAVAAVEGQAEERLARVLDAVAHPVVVIPPEEVPHDEPGGDEVGVRRRREFVRREHQPHHLVVPAVGVQRADDPVAPPPHLPVAVEHVGHRAAAVPVGVPPHVHPPAAPPLAVRRRREQAIDHLLVGVRCVVPEECIEFAARRRQAGEVEPHAAEEGRLVRFADRLQPALLPLRLEEGVNRIRDRPRLAANRDGRAVNRLERPVLRWVGLRLLPFRCLRALLDPRLQERELRGGQRLTLRRHSRTRFRVAHAFEEQTRRGLARLDRGPGLPAGGRERAGVEAQLRLLLQRAVARVAPLAQDRLDVAEVIDRFDGAALAEAKTDSREGEEPAGHHERPVEKGGVWREP